MEENSIDDKAPAKQYLQMTIGGMGNLSANPSILVMLLIPESEAGRPIREVTEQLFPVPLQPPLGQLYFPRLVGALHRGPEPESLLRSYLVSSGTSLLSLKVTSEGDHLTTMVTLRDREGLTKSFSVPMVDALIHAVLHGVPIYVDRDILLSIGSQVSFHFISDPTETPTIRPERVMPPYERITDFIRSGSKPEEMDEEMRKNVQVMLPRQWEELGEIAVETENYEWASYLQELEGTHPSDATTDHE